MSLLGNLGDAMVASAVFFLLMIFFIYPLCCFKSMELPDSVKPFSGEGGEVEMNDRNKVVPVDTEQ